MCAPNNNVQNKRTIYNKYLLFGAYQSNAKVKVIKSDEQDERNKKLYNDIALVFLLVGASCTPIEQTSSSIRSTHYMHINFSIATAPLKLFLYVILLPYFYQFEGFALNAIAMHLTKTN